MNCRDLEELLSAYADGELRGTQRDFIEEHLAGCAGCQASLAGHKQTGRRLVSLRNISRKADIKDTTMSRVKSESASRRRRRWLRPVIAGAAAVVVVFVLVTVFALPGRTPEDTLAQALANTQDLQSFRSSWLSEVRLPDTAEWIAYLYGERDYAGFGRIRNKTRSDYDYKDGVVDNWVDHEYIISDNTVYLREMTGPLPFSLGAMNQLSEEGSAMIRQPADSLKLLPDIKRMPDEKIDGITCVCYKGVVDMDLFVEYVLAGSEKLARGRAERFSEAMGDELTDDEWAEQWAAHAKQSQISLRTRQIEYEYWIGKDDGLLHQMRSVDTSAPYVKANMPLSEDRRQTYRYYDFNEDILVEPPLDDQGNLLPDWRIQIGE